MRVDSHLHLNFKGFGIDDLIPYLDREGIDICWLLTWDEMDSRRADYVPLTIDAVFEAFNAYPARVVPMYAPDPERPDAVEKFKALLADGVRGCGELKVPMKWDSPKLDPLLSCLNGLALPLVFHMEAGGKLFSPKGSGMEMKFARFMNSPKIGELPKTILDRITDAVAPIKKKKADMQYHFPGYLLDFAALEMRLKEYPRIKFIGHGPAFWKGISAGADVYSSELPSGPVTGEGIVCRLLSEYDNMYADISAYSGYLALTRDPGFTRKFLTKFSHKILYGSDNFFLGLKEFLDSLSLPEKCRRQIHGGNAHALLTSGAYDFVVGTGHSK